jgi:hypothetical protein
MNTHFMSLVVGLAHQADQALEGKIPAAAGTDARQAARLLIDTLAMLEQKTAGHLEADEAALLRDALTALRIRYAKPTP